MTYVLIGQGCWGQGYTLSEAKEAFGADGGLLTEGYTLLTFDESTVFDGLAVGGGIMYRGDPPAVTRVPARRLKVA